MLHVGDKAPEFETVGSRGEPLRLRDLIREKPVVLFFYPKDFTPVCTVEACGFRDIWGEISPNATIVGVSRDSNESHRKFADAHKIPFSLIADTAGDIGKDYGAVGGFRELFGFTRRLTYVIDRNGIIIGAFKGDLSARPHLDGVRKLLGTSTLTGAAGHV